MPASLIPAAAGVVTGGIKSISAGINLRKDKAELARLTPAFYKIQDEYYGNRNQAAELAQGGLTQASKDYYGDMSSRGVGAGVSGILGAGGSANDIGKLFSDYNSGIRSLSSEDSERQVNNIRYYQQTAKDLAGQKTIQWGVNEYQPYQNKLKELTQRIAADKQNIWGGIDQAIGAGQAAVTGSQNEKLLSGLFGGGGGGGDNGSSIASLVEPFLRSNGADQSSGAPLGQPQANGGGGDLEQLLIGIQDLFKKGKV